MSLKLSDFIQHIKRNSIAKNNRYDIVFSLPKALMSYMTDTAGNEMGRNEPVSEANKQNPFGTTKMISLSCLSADIPSAGVTTNEIQYGNYTRKIASDRSVGDFSTTFIVTGLMNEKRLFDAWNEIIIQQDNHRIGYYDDYITSISVTCLSNADAPVYHYELTEAYPIAVSQIRLDRTAQNQQMLMDVTWAFHKVKLDPNKYNAKTVADAGWNDYQKMLQQTTGGSVNELHLPDVPDVHYAQVEANDVIKATRRIRDMVKRGDISPAAALNMLRQLTGDFKALTGMPKTVVDDVSKKVGDVMAGMPIKIPGIPGNVPLRLPF